MKDPEIYPPPERLSGIHLQSLVKKFCVLKNGAETDLLEVSEEVMDSLNFLIAILLRDKTNALGLFDILPQIENDFLNPLNTGLSMSRAHYKLKLDEIKGDFKASSDQGSDVSLMVGGKALPEMSQDQMKRVIQSALSKFDLMECFLCQLNDIVTSLKKL